MSAVSLRRGAASAVLGAMLAACAGPHAPLSVGVRDVNSNVLLGGAAPVFAAPPLPPVALTLPSSVLPAAPPPIPAASTPTAASTSAAPEPPPRPPACPPLVTGATATVPATATIGLPPIAATYRYRDTGSYQTSGSAPQKGSYPVASTRQITAVSKVNTGSFTFDVIDTLGQVATTTSYHYSPPTAASTTAAGSTPTAGLYITRVVTQQGKSASSTFTPAAPGLLVLEVPFVPGTSWNATGVDQSTGVAEEYTATESTSQPVDACGTALDSVTVKLDGSVGPVSGQGIYALDPLSDTTEDFTASYQFATQYGGLSVADSVSVTGTDNGVGVSRTLTSTIDSTPAEPR